MSEAPTAARPTLGFSVEGLSSRDEMLLKSLVRLLDHRTSQHWEYRTTGGDLVVLGELFRGAMPAGPRLFVGSARRADLPSLQLPLHAIELEAMLNRLGAGILESRSASPAAAASPGDVVRLLRWPPPHLLRTPERLRLAAVLSGGGRTLAEAHRLTGASLTACGEFFAALAAEGLVSVQSAPAPSAAPALQRRPGPRAPEGLIARLRQRLGLGVAPGV